MIKSNRSKTLGGKQLGQGMTEYIIIVGLVAIVGIVAVKAYGQEIDVAIQGSGRQATNTVNAAINGGGAARRPPVISHFPGSIRITGDEGPAGGLADNPDLGNDAPNLRRDNRDAFGRFADALGN